jgi:hypothetical protein
MVDGSCAKPSHFAEPRSLQRCAKSLKSTATILRPQYRRDRKSADRPAVMRMDGPADVDVEEASTILVTLDFDARRHRRSRGRTNPFMAFIGIIRGSAGVGPMEQAGHVATEA